MRFFGNRLFRQGANVRILVLLDSQGSVKTMRPAFDTKWSGPKQF